MPFYLGNKSRHPVLVPQNRGQSQIAQRKLEQTVGLANRAGQEAIKTDGHPVRIWKRQSGSIRCTCNIGHQLADPPNLGEDMLANDPQWEGTTNSQTFSRSEASQPLGDSPLGEFLLRDFRGLYDDSVIPDLPLENPDPDTTALDFSGEEYEFDDLDDSEINPDELQRRHLGNLQRHILGVQKFRCPICFGTSYTDSYLFVSGRRYLLDASAHFSFELKGASLNLDNVPHRFEVSGPEDAVIWKVELPAYFLEISAIRIFDVFAPAIGVKAEFRESGTQDFWNPLTALELARLHGNSRTLEIRVVPEKGDSDSVRGFTHLELVYETTKLPYAQIPQLSRSDTLFSPEDIISTEAEIDPLVGYLRKESVLEVASQGSLWKIGSVTNRTTAGKQLFGYQLDMTLIHASEQISALRIRNLEHTANAIYAGLEAVQGSGIKEV